LSRPVGDDALRLGTRRELDYRPVVVAHTGAHGAARIVLGLERADHVVVAVLAGCNNVDLAALSRHRVLPSVQDQRGGGRLPGPRGGQRIEIRCFICSPISTALHRSHSVKIFWLDSGIRIACWVRYISRSASSISYRGKVSSSSMRRSVRVIQSPWRRPLRARIVW